MKSLTAKYKAAWHLRARLLLLAALLLPFSVAAWADSGLVNQHFLQPYTGAVARTFQAKASDAISVLDWGAYNDGTHITETTAAVQAAVNYGIANGAQVNFPHGKYLVTTILIASTAYNFSINSDGAEFFAGASSAQNGIFDIVNAVDFNMTGSYRLNVGDNANYASGLMVRAQAVTSHSTTRVNIHNVTVRNAKVGIWVGTYNVDLQVSEINFFGVNFFKCPVAVYNGGSQTGASYNGSNIVSEPNPAFVGAPQHALFIEGGFVTVVGGSVVLSNTSATQTILFNPASSATYHNPYGILRIAGSHIETSAQLLRVNNPRKLSAPGSLASNITLVAVGGYSSVAAATDFIAVLDSTFVGYLELTSSNFYSGVARSAFNILSASTLANIKVDKGSLNRNFLNWLGGVYGGKVLHDLQPVVNAYGLNGQTVAAGASATLKFSNNSVAGELARYGGNYVPGTGVFRVPPGGFSKLEVKVNVISGTGSVADFMIKRNGSIVAFGPYVGVGMIQATLWNLTAGETIEVVISPHTTGAIFNNGVYQSLQISGATL